MRGGDALRDTVMLLVFTAAALTAGAIGSTATQLSVANWYPALAKPPLNPPAILFPVVWGLLYLAMGFAAWLVWRRRAEQPQAVRRALFFYFVQLIFNAAWSVAFFGMRSPVAGLVVIILLLMLVVGMALRHRAVSAPAFWLTIPYALWVCFATYLNVGIAWLN